MATDEQFLAARAKYRQAIGAEMGMDIALREAIDAATAPLLAAVREASEDLDRIARFGEGGSFDHTALAYMARETLAKLKPFVEQPE